MARPLRLLVRSWVPGKGCVHQYSEGMSEAEARGLLESARDAITRAQETLEVEEVHVKNGRAFVIARRSPDPDQPSRTAPGFALVSIPDREFEQIIRSAAETILQEIPGLERVGVGAWRLLDLGGPLPMEGGHRRSRRLVNFLVIASILGLAALVLLHRSGRQAPSADEGSPQVRPSESAELPGPQEANWARIRDQIQELLEKQWARQLIGDNQTSGETNRSLLTRFTRLIRRPDVGKLTNGGIKFDELKKFPNHPFVAFLIRLPEELPVPPEGRTDLTATDAIRFWEELGDQLKGSGLKLDLSGPEDLGEKVESILNYPEFFSSWVLRGARSDVHSRRPDDRWDKGGENSVGYEWVKEVRGLIQSRYPPLGG